MKKFFVFLGVIFLILIFAAVAFIGYAAYGGTRLDASSKRYVDQNVPAIVTAWSVQELAKRASAQLEEKTTNAQVAKLFTELSDKLGPLKSYDGAKGDSNMSITTQNGKVITAYYVAHATFQKGTAKIQVKLIQVEDAWRILGFHVQIESP